MKFRVQLIADVRLLSDDSIAIPRNVCVDVEAVNHTDAVQQVGAAIESITMVKAAPLIALTGKAVDQAETSAIAALAQAYRAYLRRWPDGTRTEFVLWVQDELKKPWT